MMIRTRALYTDRLILRPFVMEDVQPAHDNWMSDPEVAHFTTWYPHDDIGRTRKVISCWIREYLSGTMDWCIVLRDGMIPIGSITAVRDHPDEGWCEMGYCLSQDYWDMGLMTEALCAVTSYIFDNTDYGWIQARHEVENEASGRVLEKSGFHEVCIRVLPNPKGGREVPYRFMRICRNNLYGDH